VVNALAKGHGVVLCLQLSGVSNLSPTVGSSTRVDTGQWLTASQSVQRSAVPDSGVRVKKQTQLRERTVNAWHAE